MRRLLAVAGLACLPLTGLAGCSSTTSTSHMAATSTGTTAPDTIVIQNFDYTPMTLTVAPGALVTVVNRDSTTHTLSSTASPHAFDTGNIAPGATAGFHAPTKAGRYSYICEIHQYMQGTLVVR